LTGHAATPISQPFDKQITQQTNGQQF